MLLIVLPRPLKALKNVRFEFFLSNLRAVMALAHGHPKVVKIFNLGFVFFRSIL